MLPIEVFDEVGSPTDFVLAGVFAVSGISFNRLFWAEIIHFIKGGREHIFLEYGFKDFDI